MGDCNAWRAQVFSTPKRGHAADEYEDASCLDVDRGCFAVADGATESSFAAEWARLLASDYVAQAPADPQSWLTRGADLQQTWRETVARGPLPWYAEEKLALGAFATFLGVTLTADGQCRALAVGDTCLIHVRGAKLLHAFPVTDPEAFGNTPWLLGSQNPWTAEWQGQAVRLHAGEWKTDDQLWLVTDAVAQWLLSAIQSASLGPVVLPFAATPEAFAAWVDAERDAGRLRNDDCTWMIITLAGEPRSPETPTTDHTDKERASILSRAIRAIRGLI